MTKLTIPVDEFMHPGHVACQGCGAPLAMRFALKALGKKTIVVIPACCWSVIEGTFPRGSIKVPIIHTAFEAGASTASGIKAALEIQGKDAISVLAWAGDGGTMDIGIQALSGAAERGDDIIYACYDNEAYMNTGIQRSSATPRGAWTTTTPVGNTKATPKKNMVEIMVAHNISYTATANIAYPEDLIEKFKKATSFRGTKFIHILAPCPVGWRYQSSLTVKLARLAFESCIFPLYEVETGRYKVKKPSVKKDVGEYLKLQGRFKHLKEDEIQTIQKAVDSEWQELLKKE